jgi:hypothetical protein
MNRRAPLTLLTLALAFLLGKPVATQVIMQPTPLPTVTAENERWYLNGDPITYAGNLYYPAGAAIFFNQNEMVRSGFYLGIPLYARTTIEPFSIVYVPIGRGRMQPYERPRSGELAGTSGSTPALLPAPRGAHVFIAQAAGAPTQTTQVIPYHVPEPADPGTGPPFVTEGSMGRVPARPPTEIRDRRRPPRASTIFIEFQNRRWYAAGPAETIDTSRLIRIGELDGFDVWTRRGNTDIIYIPVTRGGALAVPYTRTPK